MNRKINTSVRSERAIRIDEVAAAPRSGDSWSLPVRTMLKPLVAGILLAFALPGVAKLYFPAELLSGNVGEVADLSHFSQEGAQPPGVYEVDLYLNDTRIGQRSMRFMLLRDMETDGPVSVVPAVPVNDGSMDKGDPSASFTSADIHDHTGLMACLTVKDLRDLGVMTTGFPQLDAQPEDRCVSPGRYIPQAFTSFNFQKMRLDISVPQAAVRRLPAGWIPPEQWDDGITALLLGYNLNGSNSHSDYSNNRNLYLNLNNGLNIGAWRVRDNRTWSSYSSSKGDSINSWQRLNSWVERAIPAWRSQLVMGEASTNSEVFDSVSFRGAKLASDDSMYPDTMRGYAPSIRGVAGSNARVTVHQRGNLVYQTFVPPGAFLIDDLNSVSNGGDLDVTVTEADGVARTFTVPYSAVPILQREGQVRWNASGGRFRSNSDQYSKPKFFESNLLWGMPHGITTYGGVQASEDYRAVALGAGLNLGNWGALSGDITHASSTLADDSRHKGQSVRFLYSRSLSELGTTVRLTGYRYSTEGFHTLEETALKRMSGWLYDYDAVDAEGRPVKRPYTDYFNLYNSKRTQIQASISQQLEDVGSLYLSAIRQTYWHSNRNTTSMQAGFSGTAGPVNYSLSWGYSKAQNQPDSDHSVGLSMSVPFSAFTSDRSSDLSSIQANYNVSRSSNRSTTHQAGFSGTLLEEQNLNWGVQEGYARHDGNSGSANMNYRGTYSSSSLGYSYSRNYRQWNYGISGGAVLHRNGLTLGQQAGATSILVAAPGAANIPVSNGSGIRTDWRGYALVPYSTMYRENSVSLDISQLDERTEIDSTTARVVPTRGAVVRADFKARKGFRGLMTLIYKGKHVPFGASAVTMDNQSIVGEDGVVYLSGLQESGEVKVKWGRGENQQCHLRYRLTEQQMQQTLVHLSEVCQ